MKTFIPLLLSLLIGITLIVFPALGDEADEPERVIAFVIDSSGSMAKYAATIKSNLSQWMDQLEIDNSRILVLRFDSFSEVLASTTITSPRDKAALKAIITGIPFQGAYTDLDEGFRGIAAELFANDIHQSTIIFMTDKEADPNPDKAGKDAKRSLLDIIKDFPKSHKVWVIGFKPNQKLVVDNFQDSKLVSVSMDDSKLPQILTAIRQGKDALALVLNETDTTTPPQSQHGETEAISQIQKDSSEISQPPKPVQEQAMKQSTIAQKLKAIPKGVWLLVLVIAGLLVVGALALFRKFRGDKLQTLTLQIFGKPESQETFRVSLGDSVSVGRAPCDYILKGASACAVLSLDGDGLFHLAPESGTSEQMTYRGKVIESPIEISSGDRFCLGDVEVVVI